MPRARLNWGIFMQAESNRESRGPRGFKKVQMKIGKRGSPDQGYRGEKGPRSVHGLKTVS